MRYKDGEPRGSGKTYRQLQALPPNSLFICATDEIAKRLRSPDTDYVFHPSTRFVHVGRMGSNSLRGCTFAAVELDHSIELTTPREKEEFARLKATVR